MTRFTSLALLLALILLAGPLGLLEKKNVSNKTTNNYMRVEMPPLPVMSNSLLDVPSPQDVLETLRLPLVDGRAQAREVLLIQDSRHYLPQETSAETKAYNKILAQVQAESQYGQNLKMDLTAEAGRRFTQMYGHPYCHPARPPPNQP